MPDETRDVVEEASVGGEAAGKPVGHEGTRVIIHPLQRAASDFGRPRTKHCHSVSP